MSNLNSFLELVKGNPDAGVLNDPAMIELVSEVYHCTPVHRVVDTARGPMGVPMFSVQKPLIEKKIVSMPFYFYPKLVGAADGEAAMSCMMDEARGLGPSARLVVKTDRALPDAFQKQHGIQGIVNSIESRIELLGDAGLQRKKYQKRLAEKIGKARRDVEQNGDRIAVFGADESRKFYDLLIQQYRDKHWMLPQPWELFRRMFSARLTDGFVKGYGLFRGTKLLAAISVVGDSREWKYCWGATSESCDVANASAALIDNSIEDAIAAGAVLYNLGSSSPTDENLLAFKSHWASTQTPIYSYYWNCPAQKIDLNSGFRLPRWVIHHSPLFAVEQAAKILVPWLV